ncbi:hypothetical protein [uncultured Selenomonas sp.]|uniref:hypothetical protein n=1 Tax=uncultured Selenomonas sp. TaxID=159275 RepID=UPI0028E63E8D|nr:hypothetical protein [uncultured Selenomonas sp.]
MTSRGRRRRRGRSGCSSRSKRRNFISASMSAPSTAPIFYNGHVLTGAALGVRGTVNDISYDVFAAASIEKPEGFHTPDATCGFSLGWRF